MNEAANADVIEQPAGPALSATSDAPKAFDQPDTVTETTTEIAPKPEKAPAPEEILAEPGEIDPRKLNKDALRQRFSELTTKQKEALSRAEVAEAKLAEHDRRASEALAAEEAAKLNAPKPRREDFNDPDAYDAALIAHAKAQGEREGANRAQQEALQRTNQETATKAITAFQERIQTFTTEAPDYLEITNDPDLQISPVMSQIIVGDEKGPQIAYHLGKNPAEAARIAALSPPQQVYEMGKLSVTVGKPAVNLSRAPAPIARLRSNNAADKDPSQMSGDEYYAHRMAERRAAN